MKKKINKILLAFFILTCLYSARCSAGSFSDSPFGIGTFFSWNHSWNNYMYKNEKDIDRSVDLLKDLGVSIIRNEFSWNEIEKEKGIFDFERYDLIVKKCQQNNIEILGILGYTPPWTGQQWNSAPKDEALFLNYIEKTVSRYKGRIKYWEFWNEPDSPVYWCPQDGMKAYTRLLKKVYVTVKKADPSSVVVLGGLTENPYFSLKNILSCGGEDYFDIFNVHPYADPHGNAGLNQIICLLKNINKEFSKRAIDKKIWITEIACPGINRSDACNWWLGGCQDENEQAEFLEKIYSLLHARQNVEKIFWSMFRDTEHFKDGIDSFGIIRKDYSPKPAYSTYKQIITDWNRACGPSNK